MIDTLDWDDKLHTVATHNWMWSTQMRHITFGVIWEISTPWKEGWPRLGRSDGREVFQILSRAFIYTDVYLNQLWDKS